MPTYDYVCDNCLHRAEQDHGFDDDPEIMCWVCEHTMRKSISLTHLHYSAIPTRNMRWAREDAQRTRGNLEMLEGVKNAYSPENKAFRARQRKDNANLQQRVARRLKGKK